jgi:hypothetical protein
MNKKSLMFLCVVLLCGGVTSPMPEVRAEDSSLTKHVYQPRRLSVPRYRRLQYSRLKFTPRRYAWQRNVGKRIGYRSPPIPARSERKRVRIPARGPNTRRQAPLRRTRVRRRESRAARVRTVRSGLGTGDRETTPTASSTTRFRRISPRRTPRARWIGITKPKNKG